MRSCRDCDDVIWSERRDLNPRPPVPQTDALPGCATLRPRGAGLPAQPTPRNARRPRQSAGIACIPRRNIQPSPHARSRFRFRPARQSRPRPDQHRQDPSRHRAHARACLRHHRFPAPPARARELRPDGRAEGRPPRRPDHRRGEDRPARGALVLLHRRGHAARPRRRIPGGGRDPALRRPRPRPRLHRPAAARARPGRDHVPGRRDDPPAAAAAGAAGHDRDPAAAVAAQPRRPGQAGPPAAALRRGRVQCRRGLRHRRADPPPPRRLCGRHGPAQPAHPQRPGGALPGQGGRFPGGHRRDRHGPQHGRGPRRLRRAGKIRRPPPAPADPGRGGADRRPRRPRHARRHVRHHRTVPAARRRGGRRGGGAQLRGAGSAVLAQQRPRPEPCRCAARHADGAAARAPAWSRATTPPTWRRWPRWRTTRRSAASPTGGGRSGGCGRPARSPTSAS